MFQRALFLILLSLALALFGFFGPDGWVTDASKAFAILAFCVSAFFTAIGLAELAAGSELGGPRHREV